jgi:hypothetical protein
LRKYTIWWENKPHTVVTAYEDGLSCATGHGSNELGALSDLWNRLGDKGAPPALLDYVATLFRSLSGGREVATFVAGPSPESRTTGRR